MAMTRAPDLGWIDGTIWLALDAQHVRLCRYCLALVFGCDVAWGHNLTRFLCQHTALAMARVRLHWRSCWPWTSSLYVLYLSACSNSCFHWVPTHCEVIISPSFHVQNILSWRWSVCRRYVGGAISLPWAIRLYVCFLVRDLRVVFPVWHHNLTVIPCQNVLHRRWLLYFYLGCIDGTVSLTLDKQNVRLYSCVFDFEGLIDIRSNMLS